MKKTFLFFSIIILVIAQYACKKNDSSGGPPVITNVRSVDTTKRDSFFVRALPGNLIVIQGTNLQGLKAVYFNDTSAYFNSTYATSTNIIVAIPSSAQTAATDPKVPNVIKLVTDHGTTTFAFTLYLPPPAITSIAIDNSGTLLYINGYNFQGVQKITFPVPGNDTALGYTVNKTFTQITAVIPAGAAFVDSLRVYCTFGTATYSYPPPMTVTSVSNENALAGTTITINGSNFIGVTEILFPGGIPGANLQTISVTQLSVKVPAGITTPDSLRINGLLGTIASPQLFDSYITHASPGYLSNFDQQWAGDNTSFVGWTGGYADQPTAASNYPGTASGAGLMLQGSPLPGNSQATTQANGGTLQLNDVPWVADAAQPVAGYSMKFEIYISKPWSSGAIWVAVGDWYNWKSYTARYAPWSTSPGGSYNPGGWVTVTIPLSQFITKNGNDQTSWNPAGIPANVFTDYPSKGVAFLITNDLPGDIPANTLEFAIDNVRIVKGL